MPKPLKIVSIGAGNVAHHFIPALHKQGYIINQVYSRTLKNAEELATMVDAESTTDIHQLDTKADLYLVMIHDDAIPKIIAQLPPLGPTQMLAHTSGATSSDILANKADNYGCFYSLQSFKKHKSEDLALLPFMIYGSNQIVEKQLSDIALKLSDNVTIVNDIQRMKYHLAAVIMNNFTNHLACKTTQFLNENGLDPSILGPITKSTFEKILTTDPCNNQTGPAIRNDTMVESKHLEIIKRDEHLMAIYSSISSSIRHKYKETK